MKKKCEFEYNRYISSPEKWYDYCEKMLAKHNYKLEDWIDKESFIDYPYEYCNNTWEHNFENEHTIEVCKLMPCDIQLFLSNTYNFIMEWFDGHGYMYIVEFEI